MGPGPMGELLAGINGRGGGDPPAGHERDRLMTGLLRLVVRLSKSERVSMMRAVSGRRWNESDSLEPGDGSKIDF